MQYLHTMVRVRDLDASLRFYCEGLGLSEVRRIDVEAGRFTLVFLAAPDDVAAYEAAHGALPADKVPDGLPCVELTHNWDTEDYEGGRNFGHLAYRVADVYAACEKLQAMGVVINRPPRDGYMAFVRSPDGISIELLQSGDRRDPQEPWASMENTGAW